MLTGDNARTAEAIARAGRHRRVMAEVRPAEKAAEVRGLQARAASSRWSATASTMRPRWPRRTPASRWARARMWRWRRRISRW